MTRERGSIALRLIVAMSAALAVFAVVRDARATEQMMAGGPAVRSGSPAHGGGRILRRVGDPAASPERRAPVGPQPPAGSQHNFGPSYPFGYNYTGPSYPFGRDYAGPSYPFGNYYTSPAPAPAPAPARPAGRWVQGYWAQQWVPQYYSYDAWVPGYFARNGAWVQGYYESRLAESGGYYERVWVDGYWTE